ADAVVEFLLLVLVKVDPPGGQDGDQDQGDTEDEFGLQSQGTPRPRPAARRARHGPMSGVSGEADGSLRRVNRRGAGAGNNGAADTAQTTSLRPGRYRPVAVGIPNYLQPLIDAFDNDPGAGFLT